MRIGQDAPDFQLHRLVRTDTGKDVAQIGDANVRLSSFKGVRPVCLIFSSYT